MIKKVLIVLLLPLFSCLNNPVCSIDENNAGKEIYDLEEAGCFIALKLNKKKADLALIRSALIAEENYMKQIGLISDERNPANGIEESVDLSIDELVDYALKEATVNLTKEELYEIYKTEVEYLIFIGVVSE